MLTYRMLVASVAAATLLGVLDGSQRYELRATSYELPTSFRLALVAGSW